MTFRLNTLWLLRMILLPDDKDVTGDLSHPGPLSGNQEQKATYHQR